MKIDRMIEIENQEEEEHAEKEEEEEEESVHVIIVHSCIKTVWEALSLGSTEFGKH